MFLELLLNDRCGVKHFCRDTGMGTRESWDVRAQQIEICKVLVEFWLCDRLRALETKDFMKVEELQNTS